MRAKSRWSTALLVLAAILFFVGALAGFLNANIVNGPRFAQNVNQVREDPAVADAIGVEVAAAVVAAKPDLVAIQPAIEGAASALVSSSALDKVFVQGVTSFHSALTEKGSDSAVLTVADLGASAVTLISAVSPDLAAKIPPNLDVTLASVGGQDGPAATIIPLFQTITALAWILPVLAVVLWAVGVWLAPDRRIAILRIGWSWLAVAAGLAALTLVGWVASRLVALPPLQSAVAESAADVFGRALAIRVMVIALIGGLLLIAASALLPEVHVHDRIKQAVRAATTRPTHPAWAIARGLVLIAIGAGFVFFPSVAAAVVAVLVGVVIFLYGVAEVDLVAERSREQDAAADAGSGWKWAWAFPVGAAVIAVALLAVVLVPTALPQPASVVVSEGDPDACNGHVELCDRRFNDVAFPASHNSMSAADQPGWYLAEQPKAMSQSLDDGIRVFLIDTWYGQQTESGGVVTSDRSLARAQADFTGRQEALTPAMQRSVDRLRASQTLGPEKPYMCHTLCELGATELEPELAALKDWMDAHPREVVTVFIQDTVTPQDTAAVFEQAGLADMAYVHEPGQPWPTLGEMIGSGKRLLVLMENEGGGAQIPYLHQGFDVVADTGYTYASVDDFDCAPNRGPKDADLLMVNHWLSGFTTLVSSAEKVNQEEVLGPRVRKCRKQRGQIPNFVAVNWYDRGDLLTVVDQLNGFAS